MSNLPRRHLLALAVLLPTARVLAPVAAFADPSGGPVTAPVNALNDGLLQVMHAGKATPFDSRVRTLQPAVERALDLPTILQSSVGPRWNGFSDTAKSELLHAFTRFTVASWVANFDNFAGQKFEILPALRKVGADDVVQTRIVDVGGDASRLDYQVRRSGDVFKVVDILLDGSISRVAVQRSDFRSLLAGGDPNALIASLREKAANLAAGAKS